MTSHDRRAALLELLGTMSNGTMTEEEHGRLDEILTQDANARQVYFDYLDVHLRLQARWGRADDAVKFAELIRQRPERRDLARPVRKRVPLAVHYVVVAALTLAAALLVQGLWPGVPSSGTDDSTNATAQYVATISRATDCVWDRSDASRREGARLLAGQLSLKKGVAEIRFDGGAEMRVEGPATLCVESPSAATVMSGNVEVQIDETAEPFRLRTPSSTIVDYGTGYTVSVEPSGAEEIHVHDGMIQRKPKREDAAAEDLTAGEARRYRSSGVDVGQPVPHKGNPLSNDPADSLRPLLDPTHDLLAYEGFDYGGENLASVLGIESGQGWAGPWAIPPQVNVTLNASESLQRTGGTVMPAGGCLDGDGTFTISRRLSLPLALDQDRFYYFSFLFQRSTNASSGPSTFLVEFRSSREKEPQKRLAVGVGQVEHVAFVHFEGAGARAPLALESDTTYLIVGKIVASRNRPDQAFLRIYQPDEVVSRQETGSWSLVTRPVPSQLTFDGVAVSLNSKSRQMLDEIRVGTTWYSVTSAWCNQKWAGPIDPQTK